MLSLIIPAHDEAEWIGDTVRGLQAAVQSLGIDFEIIVVDDASTDATATLARESGARVIRVAHRQIAATRNAGARAALHQRLVFIDADTQVGADVLGAALRALDRGAIGGCAAVHMGEAKPGLRTWLTRRVSRWVIRTFRVMPGCFVFCTRAAHEAIGGFDETLFTAEDVAYGRALAARGRFDVLPLSVWTSARKLEWHSLTDLGRLVLAFMRHGTDMLRSREHLAIWYAPRPKRGSEASPLEPPKSR